MIVEKLLVNEEQQLLHLIEYVLTHGGQADKKSLREALQIAPATFRRLLYLLQSHFQEVLLCELSSNTIIITFLPNQSFGKLKRHLIQQSISHRILLELLQNPGVTLRQLHEKLFISESSVRRYIKRINLLIEPLFLEIKKCRLQGSEHQVRAFYLAYFEYVYGLFEGIFPYNREIEVFVQELIGQINDRNSLPIRHYHEQKIRLLCYISAYRVKDANPLGPKILKLIPDFYPYPPFSGIPDAVVPDYLRTELEREIFNIFLFALPLIPVESSLYQDFYRHQAQSQTLLFQISCYGEKLFEVFTREMTESPVYQDIQMMLFDLHISGIIFPLNQYTALPEMNRPNQEITSYREAYRDFRDDCIAKMNQYIENFELRAFNYHYLRERYDLLVVRMNEAVYQRVTVGFYSELSYSSACFSFDYFRQRLSFHPALYFVNLGEEQAACDILLTSDSQFAERQRDQYQEVFVFNEDNRVTEVMTAHQWLHNFLYKQHMKRLLPKKTLVST